MTVGKQSLTILYPSADYVSKTLTPWPLSPVRLLSSTPVVFIIAQVTQGWKWMSHWSMVCLCLCEKERKRQIQKEREHRDRSDGEPKTESEDKGAVRCPEAYMWPSSVLQSLLIYLSALRTTVLYISCVFIPAMHSYSVDERFSSSKQCFLFFFSLQPELKAWNTTPVGNTVPAGRLLVHSCSC